MSFNLFPEDGFECNSLQFCDFKLVLGPFSNNQKLLITNPQKESNHYHLSPLPSRVPTPLDVQVTLLMRSSCRHIRTSPFPFLGLWLNITTGWSNWILHRKLKYTGLKMSNKKCEIPMQPSNAPNCCSRHSDLKGLLTRCSDRRKTRGSRQ